MDGPEHPPGTDGGRRLPPEEAFALLGNGTRVDILQALWEAFESGTGGTVVAYSDLFDRVEVVDSGNFSYHLQKLTGPYVRKTEEGYELKQTGINVVRAVVAGTVVDDPTFGPVAVDVTCPFCGGGVEVAYADEILTVACADCAGAFRWNGNAGLLFIGLVPPAFREGRPIEVAFRAAVTLTFYEIAALRSGVCPHCSGTVETSVDVCRDHDPGSRTLCPDCGRRHLADAWLVCSTCKRSAFPPVRGLVLEEPRVTAFYHDRGVEHRFASWETVVHSAAVEETLRSADPFRMQVTVPAGGDELRLTVDEGLDVVEATTE